MQTDLIEMMRTQVRAIHRALTGNELPELHAAAPSRADEAEDSDEDVIRRFLELDAVTRRLPTIAERVPPFSFTPPLDVIAGADGVILELALPGVERGDVAIELAPGCLAISGVRRDQHSAAGSTYHAEIPRGPFRRVIPLPFEIQGEPRVELDRGVLRIHLASSAAIPAAPARNSERGETAK